MMNTPYLLFQSLRPYQWAKNGFVLLPLLFAQKMFHYPSLLKSLAAAALFSLLASAVYLINDLLDVASDRRHPQKKNRPLAAGLIFPNVGKITAAILIGLTFSGAYYADFDLFLILSFYIAIQLLYNYFFKDIIIMDIFCISSGFFLRVIAGAVVIDVTISNWLIICTVCLSMFLSLAKRRHELAFLGRPEACHHRKTLAKYDLYLIDQMVGVLAATSLLSYMLYCVSPETIEKLGTDRLIYTFPFVLYGIFRYLFLIHRKNEGGEPDKVLVSDWPLMLSVILWVIFCTVIVYKVI